MRKCLGLDGSDNELIRLFRLSAAEAIWRISGDTTAAVQVAKELLNDSEGNVRSEAVDLLGKVGLW